jgi:surface carbohydrate biosynthesis protein
MPDKKKTALFSIEIAARELIPKCLLALETAKSGMRVYIGSFRALKQLDGKIDECVFFHKSTWTNNAARLRKEIGAQFVFLDEEMGLAIPHSELDIHLSARHKTVSAENYKHVFAIGDLHKTCMDSLDMFKGVKVHALGWPRIDLWRAPFHQLYKKQVEELKKEHGDYYLLVSSFGAISEATFKDYIDLMQPHFDKKYDAHTFVDSKYDEFKACIRLLEDISPELKRGEKIILRPHPCESLDEWSKLLAPFPNVFLHHEGDVTPWLLASKGTIQFGSTVAIQAAFMGVPSIQVNDARHLPGLTDIAIYQVLDKTTSSDEVLNYLRDNDPEVLKERQKTIVERLKGQVGCLEGSMASTEIAKVLEQIEVAPQAPIHFRWPSRLVLWFKERINYLNYLKKKKFRNESGRVKRSKFEKIPNGLTAQEIGDHLEKLAHILGDDPKRIRCRQAAHNLVEIEFD